MRQTINKSFLLAILFILFSAVSLYAMSGASAPALPPPTGNIVNVSTEAELQNAVNNLTSNTTIMIAAGTYNLTNTLNISGGVSNVALRGATGNRDDVVIAGLGMSNTNYGNVPHCILIGNAQNVLIADLTVHDAYYHNIQCQGEEGANNIHIYNCHIYDSGEQQIKVSTDGTGCCDDSIIEFCLIEFTNRARSDYTNGIDVLGGDNWTIRDNDIIRIRAPIGQIAGPAILMWQNCMNVVCERNTFIDCDRGIAFGLSGPGPLARNGETTYDFQYGIIRNNFIYFTQTGDVGITVNKARDVKIYHNTVILNGTFAWTIEYRWDVTTADIRYNLTDGPIEQRDNATATLVGNITNAQTSWFVDPSSADLHLNASATAAIDQAATLADVTDDWDAAARPAGNAPDVGADEYNNITVALSITTTNLPRATLNEIYSATLTGIGGATPYTWTITAGALPDGLSLNANTGEISGTPTLKGTFDFTVQITDSNSDTATKALSIFVAVPGAGGCNCTTSSETENNLAVLFFVVLLIMIALAKPRKA